MISTTARRSAQLAGWVLPIVAVLCCAPAVARAGCGDYVATRLDQHAQMTLSEQQHAPVVPAAPHKPCKGPHCSRGPAAPLSPVPVVAPPTPQEWGSLLAGPALTAPGNRIMRNEFDSVHPIHLASSLFHPPRLAV
jgi:hypothetical protein